MPCRSTNSAADRTPPPPGQPALRAIGLKEVPGVARHIAQQYQGRQHIQPQTAPIAHLAHLIEKAQRHAMVRHLFFAVPAPQAGLAGRVVNQPTLAAQCLARDQRCQVFQRRRQGQALLPGQRLLQALHGAPDARLQGHGVIALGRQLRVVQAVRALVGALLAHELGHIFLQGCPFGQARGSVFHRPDHKLLPGGQQQRKRIEQIRTKGGLVPEPLGRPRHHHHCLHHRRPLLKPVEGSGGTCRACDTPNTTQPAGRLQWQGTVCGEVPAQF